MMACGPVRGLTRGVRSGNRGGRSGIGGFGVGRSSLRLLEDRTRSRDRYPRIHL